MSSRQTGVSLAELIIALAIMAVVATAAMPRKLGVTELAQAAGDAMTVNYAGCATNGHQQAARTCQRVTRCDQARDLLAGALPPGHRIEGDIGRHNGDGLSCRLSGPDGATAPFSGVVAGV